MISSSNKTFFPQKKNLNHIVNSLNYYKYEKEKEVCVFPNASTNIILPLNGNIETIEVCPNKIEISPVCKIPIKLKQSRNLEMIAIELSPYGLYYLFGIPVHELANTPLLLDDLFSSKEVLYLKNMLMLNKLTEQRIYIVEEFLSQKIGEKKIYSRILQVQNLINQKPFINIDDLSKALSISPRGLRKMFQKYYGMSPKLYLRIQKFNEAVKYITTIPSTNLVSVALDCKYYDQAHFIKEFKIFSSISPKTYQKRYTNNSDYFDLLF